MVSSYNPQSRRKRNGPPDISPVDTLLEGASAEDESPVVDSEDNSSNAHAQDSESIAKPFDTPPVEMTDERVDRLYRIGVFAAVVAIVLLLIRRKKNST